MSGSTAPDTSLAAYVGGYCARIRRDVLVQHEHESVSSPLGIWLLLCACVQGADGSERAQLESIIGCSREQAGECLDAFLSNVPAGLHTDVAGLVAVHEAVAHEDLTVVCVCADPAVDRADVVAAAHEIAGHMVSGSRLPSMSLFELELGDGHSWTITERERPAWQRGQRFEKVTDVALPAWEIRGELALLSSPAFGARAATDVLHQMIGDGPSDARQVALAVFDRYGFKAAAITAFATASAAIASPGETGVERVARIRLDHPFAAVAVVGRPSGPAVRFRGLPVFEAWIQTPTEVPADGA